MQLVEKPLDEQTAVELQATCKRRAARLADVAREYSRNADLAREDALVAEMRAWTCTFARYQRLLGFDDEPPRKGTA